MKTNKSCINHDKACLNGKGSVNQKQSFAILVAATLIGCGSPSAFAANITFAVIGPHEYELPVNYQPFNVFVQYGENNTASYSFDKSGGRVGGSKTNLFVGLSKYVYFFTLPGISDVGFAYEVIPVEVGITGPGGLDTRGIGDPLTGFAAWIKPTPNSTLGIQSFAQIPIGMEKVSNGYWSNLTSILFDVQWPMVSLTGNIGAVISTDQFVPNTPQTRIGTTFHFNARLGWVNSTIVEPFLGLDWQTSGANYQVSNGTQSAPHSEDTALGAGVMFKFSPTMSATFRYSHSVQGRNLDETNAGYFKLAYVW